MEGKHDGFKPEAFPTSPPQCAELTDDKLQGNLVLSGVVGPVEGDLDLELLTSADDEIVRVVVHGVVLHLVALVGAAHHVHVNDVKYP